MNDEGPEAGGPPRWEPAGDVCGERGDDAVQDPTVAHDALADVDPPVDQAATQAIPAVGAPPSVDPTPTPESMPVVPPPPPPPPPVDGPEGIGVAGDEEEDDPAAARRKRLIIAAAVLGVVAIAVIVALILSGGDDGAPSPSTSTSAPSTTTTTALQGEVELAPGVLAVIPEGSLTPGASLVATAVPMPSGLDALVAAGPIVDVQVEDGEILGPITLIFTLSGPATAPAGGEPVVLGVRATAQGTNLGSGTLDAGVTTFTMDVDAPGVAGPLTWRWDRFVEQARSTFRGLAEGDADGPASASCAGDVDDDEATVSATGDGIAWCVERDGDDRRVVAVNQAAFPITVSWTGAVDAGRRAGTGTATSVLSEIPNWSTDRSVTLAPGERVDLVVAPAESASISAEVDATARAGAALLGDVAFVAAIQDDLPRSDASGGVQTVLDRVDPACARSGSTAHEFLAACFPEPVLSSLVGASAAAASAPLMAPTALGVVVDAAVADVDGTLTRRGAGSVELVAAARTAWPVGEDGADPAFLDWLASEGLVHNWARCAGSYCVAGVGDAVVLVAVQSGAVAYSTEIDAGIDDPFDALVAAGLSADDAAALVVSE